MTALLIALMNMHANLSATLSCGRPLAAALVVFALAGTVPAVAGTLDSTFGAGGVWLVKKTGSTPSTNDLDDAQALAMQPGGKIVAVGDQIVSGSRTSIDFKLVRHDTDGAFDATFGTGGIATPARPQPGSGSGPRASPSSRRR